jgi:hypothetical protein
MVLIEWLVLQSWKTPGAKALTWEHGASLHSHWVVEKDSL